MKGGQKHNLSRARDGERIEFIVSAGKREGDSSLNLCRKKPLIDDKLADKCFVELESRVGSFRRNVESRFANARGV